MVVSPIWVAPYAAAMGAVRAPKAPAARSKPEQAFGEGPLSGQRASPNGSGR
jgi:hypothetical protein